MITLWHFDAGSGRRPPHQNRPSGRRLPHFRLAAASGIRSPAARCLSRATSGCEQSQQTNSLFDHLIGAGEQDWWNDQLKDLCSFEVDD